MAELFPILQDLATQEGVELAARQPGDAVSGNEAPVLVAETEGDLLQHLQVRPEGAASGGITHNQVVLTSRRPAGTLHYLEQDEFGNLQVTLSGAGTKTTEAATANGVRDTPVSVAVITLTPGKTYQCNRLNVACRQSVEWSVIHNDDGAESYKGGTYTGPGDPNDSEIIVKKFTAGGSGTQELKVCGEQKTSNVSALLKAGLELVELP